MTTYKSFRFNKVTYSTKENEKDEPISFSVTNPCKSKKPDILYKYYSVTNCAFKYSIDAFINHYLFSSHPSNLNDKYDCNGELIDYSNLSEDEFVFRLSKVLTIIPEEKVRQTYKSNKRHLVNALAELYQMILFMKFGVISLTENSDDILMWAYYSQNSGFVLKFRTSLLPSHFYGPFPINYARTLKKIDYTKYKETVCILYQSNAKHRLWKPENEWRYLTYFNKEGKYHPMYACSEDDIKTRKFDYDPNAVEEVILGYDFFNIKEIEFDMRTPQFDIINTSKSALPDDWKSKFLEHIVNNSIQCSQIIRHRDLIKLGVVKIEIKKLGANKFKIINPFKSLELF